MSIFQTLFNLFITALGGSASFHIGRVNIGVTTATGTPEVVLSIGTAAPATTSPAPAPAKGTSVL